MPAHATAANQFAATGDRLYQRLAQILVEQLSSGRYAIGDRLPAERELSVEYNVSRPAVREALIALEVQGFVEVRIGSGAFVRRLPGDSEDRPEFAITAFELTEARMVFEGEAAALAAIHISDAELMELKALVDRIGEENLLPDVTEDADREFHRAIAKATRNAAIQMTIEEFWRVRTTSPECALLHDKARRANVRPVVAEHQAILEALSDHDPSAARVAMRAHLSAVMDHLLFATEERAIEEARRTVASTRARYRAAVNV
ncbi:FadR/GntR family transcriptional regulator [uncultured Sphingomonas sp.]|uniref:FadR/GntR family transcriptional regulator n=1 Tax=uncultured Sphingomonas sp. TaxID=158754 RepID=UPI0025F06768|nr:FadR/GntR family transcriptional regulator [uncultured Sphingomonas sp.]